MVDRTADTLIPNTLPARMDWAIANSQKMNEEYHRLYDEHEALANNSSPQMILSKNPIPIADDEMRTQLAIKNESYTRTLLKDIYKSPNAAERATLAQAKRAALEAAIKKDKDGGHIVANDAATIMQDLLFAGKTDGV